MREGKGHADDRIGKLFQVGIRARPADLDAPAIRRVAESLCGVEGAVRVTVRSGFLVKSFAVELTNKVTVLRSEKHPAGFAPLAGDWKLKHFRTLEDGGAIRIGE